jgi:pimeloyl-ACP methyl ester carboxylesterase
MKSFSEKKSLVKLRNGISVGYAVYGNKKNFPIFYFHGWPGSRFELKNIPLKKEKCFIIALERPGYGISDPIPKFKILDWPKIVLEVANKFKIKKFSIIGVSGGVPFALACAHSIKNKKLKSVAIVCGLAPREAKGMNNGKVALLLYYGKKPILSWLLFNFIRVRLLKSNLENNFLSWKKRIPLPESDSKLFTLNRGVKLIKNFKEAMKYGTTGIHRDAQLYAKDWNFNIKDIKKKIFVWHGTKDLTVPITISKYYKINLKNKKMFIKPNEGHFSICYNFMNDIIQQVSV